MPVARAAVAASALFAAGKCLHRPGDGGLIGLAVGIGGYALASEAAAMRRAVRNAEDAVTVAARLGAEMPLLGGWAVEADFARLVLQELETEPGLVVEFGSGASTLVVASCLAARASGRLVSIDHDREFATATEAKLRRASLIDLVDLVVAPLTERYFGEERIKWYDTAALAEALPDEPIDLLIVDGPPSSGDWVRWPAVEFLAPRLAPGAVVLLDDGRRRREGATARRWAREHQELELYWVDTVRGTWRLQKTTGSTEASFLRVGKAFWRSISPRWIGRDA